MPPRRSMFNGQQLWRPSGFACTPGTCSSSSDCDGLATFLANEAEQRGQNSDLQYSKIRVFWPSELRPPFLKSKIQPPFLKIPTPHTLDAYPPRREYARAEFGHRPRRSVLATG
uniref:Uncharacterized protein n=1 Tax=Steinernema glaseri TaxID=37863 RepID=A0A1I7ZKP4_9BILA